MNNVDVQRDLSQCEQELDHVRLAIDTLGLMSPVAPYLTKYALIRACGAIEVSFKAIISDHCCRRSKRQVQRYINRKIRNGSANPSHSNITKFLNEFDEGWKDQFNSKLNAEADKPALIGALQSLVDARNEFAHGGSPSLSITDVIRYFANGRRVIELMDEVVS